MNGFNPTLVRLAPEGSRIEAIITSMFQSHPGSISTTYQRAGRGSAKWFQSHPGSISTSERAGESGGSDCFNPTLVRLAQWRGRQRYRRGRRFQSHPGSISTSAPPRSAQERPSFQSHPGSISTSRGRVLGTDRATVSIPPWFD